MIIWGSSRTGRKGGVVAQWVKHQAEADGRFEVDFVDLKEVALPFFDEPLSPSEIKSPDGYTHPAGRQWAKRVGKADGFILVTPEYNRGTSAVLKNALDWVGSQWRDKPVGLIGYGGIIGGAFSISHLRHNTVHLGLVQLPAAIHFPNFSKAFDDKGRPLELDYYEANIKKMFGGLERLHKIFQK